MASSEESPKEVAIVRDVTECYVVVLNGRVVFLATIVLSPRAEQYNGCTPDIGQVTDLRKILPLFNV